MFSFFKTNLKLLLGIGLLSVILYLKWDNLTLEKKLDKLSNQYAKKVAELEDCNNTNNILDYYNSVSNIETEPINLDLNFTDSEPEQTVTITY